jgi:hypothetical protein
MIRLVNPVNDPAIKFQASSGWLCRFLGRFKLVTRRISGSGRELPKDCFKEINEYLKSVNGLMKSYAANAIISFDETSIYADMLGNYTYEKRGKAKVSAVSSGHEKVRLSCLMASTLSGKKLPMVVVVPRKKPFPNFLENREVIVVYETEGNPYNPLKIIILLTDNDNF